MSGNTRDCVGRAICFLRDFKWNREENKWHDQQQSYAYDLYIYPTFSNFCYEPTGLILCQTFRPVNRSISWRRDINAITPRA